MTSDQIADRTIRVWLDLMPDEAPDRVIADALRATESTPQVRRPFRGSPSRYPRMNRIVLVAATVLIGAAAIGGAVLIGATPQAPRPTTAPSHLAVSPSESPAPTPTSEPTPTPEPEALTRTSEPLLGYEIAVPRAWIAADGKIPAPAFGVRRYGPVTVSVGTPDGSIRLCDPACREVTGATTFEALERAAGEQAGLTMNAWQISELDGEYASQIRVRLDPSLQSRILYRQLAIHDGRPVVIDFDMSDRRLSGELRIRIRDAFHFLAAPEATTTVVAPDGSYEIALAERWARLPDKEGVMVFRDGGHLLTIAAADPEGRIPTCLESVGAWETCATVRVSSLEELDEAIKPERISEHGMGGPNVLRDLTALGREPAVVHQVQAYEYPAHGAEWVTYVAAMHGGRAYILRVWTGRETGIVGMDELLAGFRFLD